jgi:hypothetical protein
LLLPYDQPQLQLPLNQRPQRRKLLPQKLKLLLLNKLLQPRVVVAVVTLLHLTPVQLENHKVEDASHRNRQQKVQDLKQTLKMLLMLLSLKLMNGQASLLLREIHPNNKKAEAWHQLGE